MDCFAVALVVGALVTTDEGFATAVDSIWVVALNVLAAGFVVGFRCCCCCPVLMDDLWLAEDATDVLDGIVLGRRVVGNCFGMFDVVRHLLEG